MEKLPMKEIAAWTAGLIIGTPLFMFGYSQGGRMITASNNVSVFAGFVLFAILTVFVLLIGLTLIKRGKHWYNLYSDTSTGTYTVEDGDDSRSSSPSKAKAVLILILSVFALSNLTGCATRVGPGYGGIRVNMYGDQRGVEDYRIVTGWVWYNPFTEEVYVFPEFLQNTVWTKDENEGSRNDESITFNSIEGAIVNADIALSYNFVSEKIPSLFVEFRKSPEHITDVYMRSKVRDHFSRHASKMKVVDIFGARKQKLLDDTKNSLMEELGPKGFNFDMVSFVGGLRVDDKVQASINAVIQATQRAIEAENKVRQAKAEAAQKIATAHGNSESTIVEAEGKAKANRILRESITPELTKYEAVQRWNGRTPIVTGDNVPFIDIFGFGKK
jgi:regulator of protease activity HflC (stomatin/prohibitin superfamily)